MYDQDLCYCTQLAEALQSTTQAAAELSLQQKLREDSELRVEELEESLLEKEQELQRQHILIARLQGEVRCAVRYSVPAPSCPLAETVWCARRSPGS